MRSPGGGAVSTPAQPPGLVVRSQGPAQLAVRRFASTTNVRLGDLEPGQPTVLALPADRSSAPWTVIVTPAGGVVTVCTLG